MPYFTVRTAAARCESICNAGGHRVQLHFLPAYAPETNPIERVWWHLHEEITRTHRCQDIEELLNLVFDWLNAGSSFEIETSIYEQAKAA